MQNIICPKCGHSHKEEDTLISWNWPCTNCGQVFRWHAYDKLETAEQKMHPTELESEKKSDSLVIGG